MDKAVMISLLIIVAAQHNSMLTHSSQLGTANRIQLGWIGEHLNWGRYICCFCEDLCAKIFSLGDYERQFTYAGPCNA